MTESTTMEKEEVQSEQVQEQEIENSILLEGVLEKLEKELIPSEKIQKAIYFVTEAARLCLEVSPFPVDQLRGLKKAVVEDFKGIGISYEFPSEKLIFETLTILADGGKLTKEEKTFIRENWVVIKKIILKKLKKRRKSLHGEREKEKRDEQLLLPRMYKRFSRGIKAVTAPDSSKKPVIPRIDKVKWDNMDEFTMLVTSIFELAELAEKSPSEFLKKLERPTPIETEEDKMEYWKRTLNIPRDESFTDEAIKRDILAGEEKLLVSVNDIYKSILKAFFKRQRNIDRCDFPQSIKDVDDVTELFKVLDKLREDPYSLSEEDLHEINCARMKLMLYLSATNINENPQYSRRESVKTYLDDYLSEDFFKQQKEEQAGLINRKTLVRAVLEDPDTGEMIDVYLYPGGDSEHPEEESSGVVNIKAKWKIILKRFAKWLEKPKGSSPDPIDIFRITVMPVEVSQVQLDKVREILGKTIAHAQSKHPASIVGVAHNDDSEYEDKDIDTTDVIISPYVVTEGGKILRGYVKDIKSQDGEEIIKTGPVNLEIRTGLLRDIIAEHNPDDDAAHGPYTQTRMLEPFNQMIYPKRYRENWIGKIFQELGKMQDSLHNRRTLPGIVALTIQRTKNVLTGAKTRGRRQLI